MDNFTLQLNEFFVEGNDQERSHVLLHITEPSTPEEEKRGYFFAICDATNADNKYLVKLQDIIDNIESSYYETSPQEGKDILEITLENINQQSYALIKENRVLNCVVGAIRPPEIVFSFYNQPQVVLFYKKQNGIYQKMDLITANQNAEEGGEARPHLFSQIIQGKISSHDYLFIGTPNIISYFSHDRLQKIITSRPTRQSADHLERVLSELRNGLSFGGLIIHLEASAEKTPGLLSRHQQTSNKQINPLFVTEQNTASTLSPSLFNRLNSQMRSWQNSLTNSKSCPEAKESAGKSPPKAQVQSTHLHSYQPARNPAHPKPSDVWIKACLLVIKRILIYAGHFLVWLFMLILLILKTIGRFGLASFFIATNFQNRRRNVLESYAKTCYSYKQNIRQLPRITKVLILILTIAIVILSCSIIIINYHRQATAAQASYQEAAQLIAAKKDIAESALIYNDTASALNEIAGAKAILSGLSCQDKDKAALCQKFTAELADLLSRARKVTSLQPHLLMDWSDIAAEGEIQRILKANNKLVAFGPQNTALFIYDLLTKESKLLHAGYNAPGFSHGTVPKENDYALLLFNQKDFLQFNPQNDSVKKIEVDYPSREVTIKGIAVYNRRLYSLDALNNQIYRHDSTKTGFAMGKEWLGEKVDLNGGVYLAIEGDVFALKDNGEIYKFAGGKRQEFAVRDLDPPLAHGTEIWSYNDLQYIYILDSENKRLVILEKDGRLKKQMTAAELTRPTSMVIDEPGKTAFILNNNKLYQISL